MGEDMEGAMQQAAQPIRQFMQGLPNRYVKRRAER
jgi:hypothetical protein